MLSGSGGGNGVEGGGEGGGAGRLAILESSHNGFSIAEADLVHRCSCSWSPARVPAGAAVLGTWVFAK